jgi:hypothetical protein
MLKIIHHACTVYGARTPGDSKVAPVIVAAAIALPVCVDVH